MLWFAAQMGALVVGEPALGALYAVVAAVAAWQVAVCWIEVGERPEPAVSAAAAGASVVAAMFHTGALGGVVIASALVSVGVTGLRGAPRGGRLRSAGYTVQAWLPVGLAGASPVMAHRISAGGALTLLLFVAIYEAGNFAIGSGSSSEIEGPLSGLVGVAVVAFAVAVFAVPPFEVGAVAVFAAGAGLLLVLGPAAGSLLLPRPESRAPGLRRIDSLLLAGPAWVWALGLYSDSLTA